LVSPILISIRRSELRRSKHADARRDRDVLVVVAGRRRLTPTPDATGTPWSWWPDAAALTRYLKF
jgi:hypothetical protein